MTITAQQPSVIVECQKRSTVRNILYKFFFFENSLEYISDHASILGDKIEHYVNKTIRESL